MGIEYATADDVRDELQVSASEYPSKEDSGVSSTGHVDRWLTRAGVVIDERISESMGKAKQTEVEILVAAHFGHGKVSQGDEGYDVTVAESMERVVEFAPTYSEGPDGRTSPFWDYAITLEPSLRRGFDSFTN